MNPDAYRASQISSHDKLILSKEKGILFSFMAVAH